MATDYFIDFDTGNNGDNGLIAADAWLTEAYALTQMTPGDTLKYVKVYWDGGATDSVLTDWEALINGGMITETQEIKHFEITWELNSTYEPFGRYCIGDFWIFNAGGITISAITPAPARSAQTQIAYGGNDYICLKPHTSDTARDRPSDGTSWTTYWVLGGDGSDGAWADDTLYACLIKHGTQINPVAGTNDFGYDGRQPEYTPAANKVMHATANSDLLPLAVAADSSVISTKSLESIVNTRIVSDASVLTVVDTEPSVGDFRPCYVDGINKNTLKNISDIDGNIYNEILQSIDASGDGVALIPTQSTMETAVNRVWLDHGYGSDGRTHHPVNQMEDYGQDIARKVGSVWLWLHLNESEANKTMLLRYCLQKGIDNYGITTQDSTTWFASGGHGSGRHWPVIFAGIVFGDTGMKNVGDTASFQEVEQTFTVIEDDIASFPYNKIDDDGTDRWANYDQREQDLLEYSSVQLGMPEWGMIHHANKSYDGRWRDTPQWATDYRVTGGPKNWVGMLLAAMMTNWNIGGEDNGKEVWDHDVMWDYNDRYIGIAGISAGWQKNMWLEYATDYRTLWTGSYDITKAATPTALTEVSKSNNSAIVSWSGTSALFDISVSQTTAHLNVTSPYTITGLNPEIAYEMEVWGKKANGIRSLQPDEITVTTEASPMSLLVYWTCDDNAASTNVLDSSGNNYTATLNGGDNTSVKSENGKVGRAFHLNGTDDFFALGDQVTFATFSTTVSAAAWINVDAAAAGDQVIVGQYTKQGDDRAWSFNVTSDLKLRVYGTDDGTFDPTHAFDAPTDSAVITAGLWHHVAFTWSSGTLVIYVDGISVPFTNAEDPITSFNNATSDVRVGVSLDAAGAGERFFDGLIDEVRLYDEALSEANIKTLAGGYSRNGRGFTSMFRYRGRI